jgi:phospholipid/cholesterol/gamma-HCH transport system substrate-binding protein
MPSQQEVRWSQLKIGVIVLVSLMVLTVLLFLMTSASGLGIFSKSLTVTAHLPNAAGLKSGGAVTLEGVTIGEVKSVTVTAAPDHKLTPVLVVMKIDSKYQPSLHVDSKASISTVGVLGDTVMDINSEFATGSPLKDGDEIQTLAAPSIPEVIKSSQGAIEQLNVVLSKINSVVADIQAGKGSVGQLLTNPELYNKATKAIDQLNTLEASLNQGRGSAGKFLTDESMYNSLNDTAAKLDEIATSLNGGKGSGGKLLKDDKLYDNLNSAIAHANSLLAEADAGRGGLGILTKDPAFAKNLNDTVANVNTLVTNINAGKGTLGKFATDDKAYTNLNLLLTQSTELVTAVRKDPKQYLVIHLKIF